MVRLDQFTEEHLELSDLWRWQDGVREQAFLVPLATAAGVVPDVSLLLVRALFRLPVGIELQGLLAYDPLGQDVYAVQVLIGPESFSFNKYLPEASFEEVLALADHLGVGTGAVLPVRYSVVRDAVPIRDGHFTLWVGG
ncbi:hypothetical protein N7414_11615 [Pseudomonas sp. GD04087]|uniref:hypothetical protein n=1 Tax=unclassified Pseudomonas TaxID=196821 RepID=UPI002449D8C6|nr:MULTISPECIES: hypothetical protein [unclassified Pseudomonas]MDH0289764.1 hypothetical protein [Pseudomonas sp. GD04087]MDH1049762.1 hypothetical protein [Pseudomonas sp. GD03903]MDH2002834.1 hypothetical protein [Pseudomonas sp. GD03691]